MTSLVRNARTDYHLDTRIRRRHVPLFNQQRRLRHLKCLVARNITPVREMPNNPNGVYFTLHESPTSEAFYTSEVAEDFINPAWRMFETSSFPENINTSNCYISARVWFHYEISDPVCAIEWFIYFSGLVFLGEQIPKEGKKFCPNTLLFGTAEGFYGSPDCLHIPNLVDDPEYSVKESIPADPSSVRVSYSVNTVHRIQTVQRAIKQTQATVRRTRASIQEKMQLSSHIRGCQVKREHLRMNIAMLKLEFQKHSANIEALRVKKNGFGKDVKSLIEEQYSKVEQLSKERMQLVERRRAYYEMCETLLKTTAQLNLRRKQLISELSCIYPIVEFPDKKGFSICGVHLPHSEDFTGRDETMIAIALGYVTHLVLMISHFLNVPLRYPLNHFGSRSTIYDFILDKIADKDREFPLFSRGKDRMHFFYGVYLLNKNIAQLRQYCALGTSDLRLTLANLHSLIEIRLSIKNEQYGGNIPYASVFQNSLSPTPTPPPLQVQIKSDPSQAIAISQNGNITLKNKVSLEVQIHAEMVATLEREMATMTPTPTHQSNGNVCAPPPSTGLKTLSINKDHLNLSGSLDKGLNKIRILQINMSKGESLEEGVKESKSNSRSGSFAFQGGTQHTSVPDLTLLNEVSKEVIDILKTAPEPSTFNPSLNIISSDSVKDSDDEQLDCQS